MKDSDYKQFDGIARDPASQFQIGDAVLYLPEGIYATVEGYLWLEETGDVPRIVAYRLSCGVEAHGSAIALRWSREVVARSAKPGQSRFP